MSSKTTLATSKITDKAPTKRKKAAAPPSPPLGKTFVGVVLDQSGSMSFGKDVTIRGFNEQLQTIQRGAQQLSNDTRVTFLTFNDQTTVLFDGVTPDRVEPLNDVNYTPSGCTALFDAVDACVKLINEQPGSQDENAAILMLLFTDGEENSSKNITGSALGEKIKSLEATGRWTFTLLGPSEHVKDLASILHLKQGNVQGFDTSSLAARAASSSAMAGATMSYFSERVGGSTQVAGFYGGSTVTPPNDVPTPTLRPTPTLDPDDLFLDGATVLAYPPHRDPLSGAAIQVTTPAVASPTPRARTGSPLRGF